MTNEIWGSKRLSVVIITWNQMETTRKCLTTLVSAIDPDTDEVILIDNGSEDGTADMVATEFPLVLYHKLEKNIGVGPARNRGIALSCGSYLMTLDNDTLVPGGLLIGDLVADVFRRHPRVGLFGFKLLNPDGTKQSSARRFPRFMNPIASRVPVLRSLTVFRQMLAAHLMEDVEFDEVVDMLDVDYVLGANQVFRRAVLADTHAYDPDIFYGPEDYEFCLRVWRTGWTVGWTPVASIVHEHRRITRRFSPLTMKFIAAHIRIFIKNRGTVERGRL